MDEIFTEIIFPSNPKPVAEIKPNGSSDIEYWIVGESPFKALYVQCPICYFSFRLATVMNEGALKEYIEKYPSMYYNAAIRECPERDKHGQQIWHKVV